jgi:MFS family permease
MTRNLKVLSFVSLLQDTASELLYPILPIILTTVLHAPVAAVGAIEGIADGIASLTKVVSGRLADKRSKRGLVGLGYGLAALAKMIIALATSWPVVMAARSLDRIGKGIRGAPRDALIAATTDPADRGKAFGYHRAMDSAGAVIGPLLGLGLYELLNHRTRPLLFIATIPAVASVALVSLVREPRVKQEQLPPLADTTSETEASPTQSSDNTALGPPFWNAVSILGVFAFVNFSDALLILRARQLGLSVAAVIGTYCLYNAVYASLSYPAGALSDRLPRQIVLAVGFAAFAIAYAGLGLATSASQVWWLFGIYGVYTALTDGVSKAWISDLLPDHVRGRGLGIQQGISGLGAVAASVWAGLAWDGTGKIPLLISACVAATLALALALRPARSANQEVSAS